MPADSLLRLSLIALGLTCVPLLFWLWRSRGGPAGSALARLTALTLFLTFDLIAFGAFTRLTDSGLGCPDWPGCYNLASPLEAQGHIAAAQTQMPDGPVTWAKAWIEMIHRYLAMAVGALILLSAVLAWRQRKTLPHSPFWAALTLVWVIVQGLFGKYTVTWKLYPAIVTLHLLGAMALLALLAAQHASFGANRKPVLPTALRWGIAAGLSLLLMQVALGGWVSTNYAVLVCDGFPTCNGQWWPAMAWQQGFALLRELGHTADGQILSFEALVAIHWTHRLFALLVAGGLGWLAWRLGREPDWRRWGLTLAGLLLLQCLTGLSNVVLRWPLAGAVLHTAGAAAMVAVLTHVLTSAWLARRQLPDVHPGPAAERPR